MPTIQEYREALGTALGLITKHGLSTEIAGSHPTDFARLEMARRIAHTPHDAPDAALSAPQTPDASALMLAALKGAANALSRFERIAELIGEGKHDLAKMLADEPWNPEVAAVNAAIRAAEGREG